jgi:hypothetical protein
MTTGESVFVGRDGAFEATEWAVGPWSADAVQGSASAGLLARAAEAIAGQVGMSIGRLAFDLWRPVPRARLEVVSEVLRDGRKAKTVALSLRTAGAEVARCAALLVRPGPAGLGLPEPPGATAPGPDEGRPIPEVARRWSPFFTGVDTRVIEGDLLRPGPASVWFRLARPLVAGEDNSALVQAVSAADLTSGISAVTDLRVVTFVNPELTLHLWRMPRGAWILAAAETIAGDHGRGVAHAVLSDAGGPFGRCAQVLLFDRARA